MRAYVAESDLMSAAFTEAFQETRLSTLYRLFDAVTDEVEKRQQTLLPPADAAPTRAQRRRGMFTDELDALVKRMTALLDEWDTETAHDEGDKILIEWINQMTAVVSADECAKIAVIVDAWERMEKWYA